MSTGVYEVFTKLSMVDGTSATLALISKKILSVDASIAKLTSSFATLNRTSMTLYGGLSMVTGGAIIGGFAKLAEHAGKLQSIQEGLKVGGVNLNEIARSTDKALIVANKFGQKWEDILETMAEIRIPLGDVGGGMDHTIKHIDSLAASMVVLKSLDAKTGGNIADQVYNLVRSAEFRNSIKGDEFDKSIDMMTRAAITTKGRVNPGEFFAFSKYSRGALSSLSDDFLYTYGPELMQEFKGSGAGNVMSSLYQQIVGGMLSTTGLNLLMKLDALSGSQPKPFYSDKGKLLGSKNEYFQWDKYG